MSCCYGNNSRSFDNKSHLWYNAISFDDNFNMLLQKSKIVQRKIINDSSVIHVQSTNKPS